jgi:hypothetical protein
MQLTSDAARRVSNPGKMGLPECSLNQGRVSNIRLHSDLTFKDGKIDSVALFDQIKRFASHRQLGSISPLTKRLL